jgi:hypothetical protein
MAKHKSFKYLDWAILVIAILCGYLLCLYLGPLIGVIVSSVVILIGNQVTNTKQSASGGSGQGEELSMALHASWGRAEIAAQAALNDAIQDMESLAGIQTDAIKTLMGSFLAAQALLGRQQETIERLLLVGSSSEVDHSLKNTCKDLALCLQAAIRSLQFEDMAAQKIQHHIETLRLLSALVAAMKVLAVSELGCDDVSGKIEAELGLTIEKLQLRKYNPVSATSMKAGDVDLFCDE